MTLSRIINFFKISGSLSMMDSGIRRELGISTPNATAYSIRSPFKGGNGHF